MHFLSNRRLQNKLRYGPDLCPLVKGKGLVIFICLDMDYLVMSNKYYSYEIICIVFLTVQLIEVIVQTDHVNIQWTFNTHIARTKYNYIYTHTHTHTQCNKLFANLLHSYLYSSCEAITSAWHKHHKQIQRPRWWNHIWCGLICIYMFTSPFLISYYY